MWFLFEVFIYSPALTVLSFDHELSKSFTCLRAPSDKGVTCSRASSTKSYCWCSFPSALFLSTRLTSNPLSFLLPSFLHQHVLFTKASIYQGLCKVDTTHASFCLRCQAVSSWVPALGSCQSLGPAVLLLPDQEAQGETEGLHASLPMIGHTFPFPALCEGLTHLLPFVLTWTVR